MGIPMIDGVSVVLMLLPHVVVSFVDHVASIVGSVLKFVRNSPTCSM